VSLEEIGGADMMAGSRDFFRQKRAAAVGGERNEPITLRDL